jgi:predicted O-methyltransferase YrrM
MKVDYSRELFAEYQGRCGVWSDIVDHLPTLHATVMRYAEPAVIELGVRSGNSTAAFLAAASQVDGHVWSVDIQLPQAPGWWWETKLWTPIVGNDLDPAVLARLPEQCDVLFIDTSHAYDHTLRELRTYAPMVRPGGVVLCHDTELEAPELVGPQPPFPVAKAISEYCTEAGLEWVNNTGCYGLGVIAIPGAA